MNAIIKYAIVEHLINKQKRAKNYKLDILNVTKTYYNVFYLLKTKAIHVLFRKPLLSNKNLTLVLFYLLNALISV